MFDKARAEFFGTTHARQEPRPEIKPEVPVYWMPRYQEWLSLDAAQFRAQQEKEKP